VFRFSNVDSPDSTDLPRLVSMPSRINDADIDGRTNVDSPSADLSLLQLKAPSFDAVSFLNDTLPVLTISSAQQPGPKGGKVVQIQDASAQLQGLLTKVNAQHIRSSSQLTQVTDDILRSGSRLAYEVEVLRGDANGLYEVLTETLKSDISHFVTEQVAVDANGGTGNDAAGDAEDPDFIIQLRMLGQVKARLEAVIGVFGEAMKWNTTSENSVTSSLISVSAPELAMMETTDRDKNDQETANKYRSDIIDLLDSDGGGYAGLEAAAEKVETLRLLCIVWKGTAEERTRTKFVDSLSKLVEDRRKSLGSRAPPQRARADSSTQRSSSMPGRPGGTSGRNPPTESSNAPGGLFRNLQKLRDEIYLD
jgi:hypothetical protein